MKLRKLLKKIPVAQVKGSKDVEITGICANSKVVAPGNLFIAKKGLKDDGNRYIADAVATGAVAVLTDIYDPFLEGVTQVIVPDPRDWEADLATTFYDRASDQLFMVGITGTNGKTITSFLVKHLLDQSEMVCGLMGTVEYIVGRHHYSATHTTPDVSTNHKLLREMVTHGCKAAVMEVTSHGLDQERVANVEFDVAVFTNLTQDHLDYHEDMDAYCDAKARLFSSLGTKLGPKKKKRQAWAVVNHDDPWTFKIVAECSVPVMSYGLGAGADLLASNLTMTPEGTTFTINYQGDSRAVEWPLIGRFNVYNYLAAAGVGLAHGLSLAEVVEKLKNFSGVRGRLQEVTNDLGVKVYVDFAHTDDALSNVLDCLKEIQKGRIITVFGCGGCRDRSKRPKMAQACERFSDLSIVTSDNPRKEIPEAICEEVAAGFKKKAAFRIEPDRRRAIAAALSEASPGDIVLVAGKGHETYQIFAHKTIEFDDVKVCEEELEKLAAARLQPS